MRLASDRVAAIDHACFRRSAIAFQKGGTGKTTTAVNLAAALTRAEQRVLLVDLDPQGSLTEYFTNPALLTTTIYDALLHGHTVTPLKIGELVELIPATIDLAAAEIQLPAKRFQERTLTRVLKHHAQYDYCLIDCPPGLGVLTTNALTAASLVIVPVSTELMAERTVKLILDTVEEIREADPTTSALRIWRILPTLYDTRLAHHREILAALRVKYPRLLYSDPVKATTKYKDAVTERADAGYLDPKIAEYWDKLATLLIKESNIVKEASDSETVLKSQGKEGRPSQSDAVIQQDSDMVKREQFTEKITFYLTVEQANKLDDLAHDYKKRRGKRINRNDIVRYPIDHCTLESLEAMSTPKKPTRQGWQGGR